MKKYLVCPNYTRSKYDGEEHFITAMQLINLYRVNPNECDILPYHATPPEQRMAFSRNYKKILTPKYDGDYDSTKEKQEMQIITGTYTTANIYAKTIEQEALEQVQEVVNHPAFEGEQVRIMPDCHAGAGCVIGFTSTNKSGKVIPNLIGVDIGCGMTTAELGKIDIDLQKLDKFICKNIPCGFNVNENIHPSIHTTFRSSLSMTLNKINDLDKYSYHLKSIGTLGGGNHFIEISEDKQGNKYLIIHSGSRNFGHRVASYFQKLAQEECQEQVHKDLKYLEGQDAKDYKECMMFAQEFAKLNRFHIVAKILSFLGLYDNGIECFETVHNYIDYTDTIRKGAISAQDGEKVLIPLNMRDGSILALGKGNPEWNYSAPHGAGRILSRAKAKRELKLEDFQETMQGVFTSSICESTLDEAPAAYKSADEIIKHIGDTVEIIDILKPIYNFKAH